MAMNPIGSTVQGHSAKSSEYSWLTIEVMRIEDHRLSFLTAHLAVSIDTWKSFISDHVSKDTVSLTLVLMGERVSILLRCPAILAYSESGRFISIIDLFFWVFNGVLLSPRSRIQSQELIKILQDSERNTSSESEETFFFVTKGLELRPGVVSSLNRHPFWKNMRRSKWIEISYPYFTHPNPWVRNWITDLTTKKSFPRLRGRNKRSLKLPPSNCQLTTTRS